jgi:hypothetical protein
VIPRGRRDEDDFIDLSRVFYSGRWFDIFLKLEGVLCVKYVEYSIFRLESAASQHFSILHAAVWWHSDG